MSRKKKEEEETEESGSKKDTRFVGGYLHFETVKLLKEDAKLDKRTLSMQLEYLVLMAMRMRGHDIASFSNLPKYNREFQDIEEFLQWKAHRAR